MTNDRFGLLLPEQRLLEMLRGRAFAGLIRNQLVTPEAFLKLVLPSGVCLKRLRRRGNDLSAIRIFVSASGASMARTFQCRTFTAGRTIQFANTNAAT